MVINYTYYKGIVFAESLSNFSRQGVGGVGDLYPSFCSSSLNVFYSPKNNPTCRKCGTEEETSVHILCECKALASLRHTYLGSFFWGVGDIRKLSIGLELC